MYCVSNIDKSSVHFESKTSTDVNYICSRLMKPCIPWHKMIILYKKIKFRINYDRSGTSGKIPGFLTFLQRFYKTGIGTGISGNGNSQSTWNDIIYHMTVIIIMVVNLLQIYLVILEFTHVQTGKVFYFHN